MTNDELQPLSETDLCRILSAATPLPDGLGDLIQGPRVGDPRPDEIWRIGRDQALLVWVRQVFSDGVADVVPMVLDVELADEETVVVEADATPIASELAAMVALRTHVDLGACLNRIGTINIRSDVTEVMTATREGRRPNGVRVGPPVVDDGDSRIAYRQALRYLLYGLTPGTWREP
jgi:hypothetical protein